MNCATFIGNLTRDAVQKLSNNHKHYTTFDIAINEKRGQAIANLDLLVNQLELLGGNKNKAAAPQPQQPGSGFAPSSAPNQPNVTDEEDLPF